MMYLHSDNYNRSIANSHGICQEENVDHFEGEVPRPVRVGAAGQVHGLLLRAGSTSFSKQVNVRDKQATR